MRVLGVVLVFGGYMLVYAAVAKGGKFATEPWAGLYADAYTDNLDLPPSLAPIVQWSRPRNPIPSTTFPGHTGTPSAGTR